MASLHQKIAAERSARAMLDDQGVMQPDEVQYGHTCIRLLWYEQKVVMIVDIDEPPPEVGSDGEVAEVMTQAEDRERKSPWEESPPY